MNQKSLTITIIAIVAIIVIMGLWLAGAAGSGPLAGCSDCVVAPLETTLTMNVWVYNESTGNEREIVFEGALTAGSYALTDRTVTIGTGGSTVATVTTNWRGIFTTIYTEAGGSHSYVAFFAGDDQYFSSESSPVASP